MVPVDVEKVNSTFNLQNELSEYRDTITKMVKGQGEFQSDI